MAFHYVPKGYTEIRVGWMYSRYPVTSPYSWAYELTDYNEATGICRLQSQWSSGCLWLSVAELSTWYRVGMSRG